MNAINTKLAPSEAKRAVIVGAGPAGLLTAILLARRGYNVQVFERRLDPASDGAGRRSVVFALVPRGQQALRRAGVRLPEPGSESPWLNGIAIARPNIIHLRGEGGKEITVPGYLPRPGIMVTERLGLTEHLTAEAKRLHPDRIQFYYQHYLESIDFAQQIASFRNVTDAHCEMTTQYNLLIGADGRNSRTRSLLCGIDSSLSVRLQLNGRYYKGFSGLKCPEGLDVGSAEGVPLTHLFCAAPIRLVVWVTGRGTMSGYIVASRAWFEGRENTPERYEADLRQHAIGFPEEWVTEVAEQLAEAPLSDIGTVKCSKFDGPATVLLGDAANAVTPLLGQGMNSALESAAVLDQVLDVCKDDISIAPARFTQIRRPDLHALSTMDVEGPYRNGMMGKKNFTYLSTRFHTDVRTALHKALPALVAAPEYPELAFKVEPYSKVLLALRRDQALLVATLALGLFAIPATAILAAGRLRGGRQSL